MREGFRRDGMKHGVDNDSDNGEVIDLMFEEHTRIGLGVCVAETRDGAGKMFIVQSGGLCQTIDSAKYNKDTIRGDI